MPGTLFLFVAPLIWPFETALLLSTTGTMAASVIAFSFVLCRSRLAQSQDSGPLCPLYNDALAHRAFVTVVLLRMVFWTSPATAHLLGLSKSGLGRTSLVLCSVSADSAAGSSYFGPQLLSALKGNALARACLLVLVAVGIGLCAGERFAPRKIAAALYDPILRRLSVKRRALGRKQIEQQKPHALDRQTDSDTAEYFISQVATQRRHSNSAQMQRHF